MATRTHTLLGILAVALIASVSLSAQKAFDRRFDVAPGGQLRLDADVGSVALVGRAGHEVVVHAQVNGSDSFLADLDITAEQTSSGVTVTAHKTHSGWFDWFNSGSERVHFTIDVPRDYSVELRTSGGSLDVRNVNAPVQGRTSGGGITVADVQGDLDAHTSGGGIHLKNIDASVRASTSGGGVHAEMRSNRGISLSTSGGPISLLLPANVGASLDARTSGGSVSSALPFTTTGTVDHSHLHGSINGGGEQVVLRTSGGGISVGPLP